MIAREIAAALEARGFRLALASEAGEHVWVDVEGARLKVWAVRL